MEAVAIKTPFCDFDCGKGCGHRVKEVADSLGIRLKTVYFGDNYLAMLKNPKHGFGSGMNPCIDCRAMMYEAAKDHMETIGARTGDRRSIIPEAYEPTSPSPQDY